MVVNVERVIRAAATMDLLLSSAVFISGTSLSFPSTSPHVTKIKESKKEKKKRIQCLAYEKHRSEKFSVCLYMVTYGNYIYFCEHLVMYITIESLLYIWNHYDIVYQLYFNKKNFFKWKEAGNCYPVGFFFRTMEWFPLSLDWLP